jgi:voltage-gated potassium channel Kch
MMIVTTIIHAGGQAVGLRWLILSRAKHLQDASIWIRSLVVGALVLILFLATLVEASAWASAYLVLDAIPDFETALYFSTVTYTTLGYGDIVLEGDWRLLASFQAANGIIMFGWTTALIIIAVRHFSTTLPQLSTPRRS